MDDDSPVARAIVGQTEDGPVLKAIACVLQLEHVLWIPCVRDGGDLWIFQHGVPFLWCCDLQDCKIVLYYMHIAVIKAGVA